MPRSLVIVLLTCCVGLTVPAGAQTAYEAFDYTIGQPLNGQNGGIGFSGAYTASQNNYSETMASPDFQISSALTYGSLATFGNAVSGTPYLLDFRSLSQSFGSTAGTTLYASFLIRPDGSAGTGAYGGFALTNYNPDLAKPLNAGGVLIGEVTGGYGIQQYGADPATATNTDVSERAGTTPQQGAVTLMVVKFSFLSGNDKIELFVNPTLGAPLPSAADATLTSFDLNFNRVYLEANERSYTFDEFRLGDSFSSVTPVPEPSTYAAGALAVAAVLLTQRRRVSRMLVPLRGKRGGV